MDTNEDISGLLAKVKNYLVQYYEPAYEIREADFHYTTDEIYWQLQKIARNELLFSSADVSAWLHNAGFTFADFGEMRFEWMMKKARDWKNDYI